VANANFAAVITLVLGGARSGKSEVAERLTATRPVPITYIATAAPLDDDFAARIAAHRDRRPSEWKTVEAGAELVTAVRDAGDDTVLIESLGPWVAAHDEFRTDTAALVAALTSRGGDTVVVSEEVGLSVHPSSEAGRRFRDALGDVNRAVAEVADGVLLVVAGCVLSLDPPDRDGL
jgi:adenosyl cobinamide kinase/adenosyl cobinamide phosphate guanylyltransferase